MAKKENKDCFVIMPISDTDGYDKGHFSRVYEDIIKPAVANTDFSVTRADEVKETNFIHLDILKQLIDAPIAICDLSSHNPNVLFELGIRQAFDKPVVLIREEGTPKIFDIGPLRYLEYSKKMKYHDVLRTQAELTESINATKEAKGKQGNINSIVRLMALSNPAAIPTLEGDNKEAFAIDVLQSQMNDIRKMMETSMMENRKGVSKGSISSIEYERISNRLDRLMDSKRRMPRERHEKEFHRLMREAEEVSMHFEDKTDHRMFRYLQERIHNAMRNDLEELM
ncbi:hypothetical protein [uncultured Gammaproteobacteria bacterium]|jgi:hypothetical protein|uniref:Uncharacterized protein n=1 Tax=Bathymodiolus thermophilus thioautotrophic gill symbiont TaxID=2360 RepID=A0ABN7GF81_9GAMM|nr:hypothetical protein [Bathymodiolus thermophilus thioautotrophic gill symbiont]CAC9482468.1 hypothetical protein [uncultured Gammaproteobacteria bacterium]CAB5508442.1 hypothetical protein AZO1586I_2717 [Bathymodiolus thermophilus thioautotrophic gill symbiont]CAC9978740.1 hypothetical protein [uncultured Gammaproteobacteria bacterium]CAC9991569.1 hypothetical protein [uncultured Gammaproteobacteria bacterium]VVH56596.1 hypothetical protein BAZOLSSOX_2167 [uncultured Gammaproteobacteria bac